MARTNIPIRQITRTGEDPATNETTPDAADDAMFLNDGKTWIKARNAGAGSHIVTVVTPKTVAGLAVADLTVTVPAAATRDIGPFPPADFNQQSGADEDKVYVNVDGTKTEMRYKAHKLGN